MLPFSKTQVKFEMIQNYREKLKTLKLNLIQSQKLNQTLKQDLLKIGQQSNSLLISISVKANRVTELKSLNPQRQKELYFMREQLKRIQYKTEKNEIKLQEYEDRLKRFQDMYQTKKQKNQTLIDKISKLQSRINEQKEKQTQLNTELGLMQPKKDPSTMPSLKVQSQYLKSLAKKSNPLDDLQIQILNMTSKMKKLTQEHQEIRRKNNQLKSSINKLQQEIQKIQQFMSQSSCIPDFVEGSLKSDRDNIESMYKTSRSSNMNHQHEERILKYSDKYNLAYQSEKYPQTGRKSQYDSNVGQYEDRIRKPSNQLPFQITSSLSNFQSLKSKSILDSLMYKHSQITEKQHQMMDSLKQNSSLMSQLTKINSVLESQIVQENSKLSAFNIRNKKYTQMHQRSIQ